MAKASKIFKDKLTKLLKEGPIGVYELAKKAGVSPQIVYDFKSGKSAPSLDTAERIANALGFSLDAFITDPNQKLGHSVNECFKRVSAEWRRKME